MLSPRVQERYSQSHLRRPVICEFPRCSNSTKKAKPYCSDHVEEHPYVRKILEEVESKQCEVNQVARLGPKAVDPQGLTAREILNVLRVCGPRTVRRMALELQYDPSVIDSYVEALRKAGKVTKDMTGRTRRRLVYLKDS